VTLPSPPGLRCLFALAVSLRARPPFTLPGPMAGERFSGPDNAYLCLQHNTTPEHIHEGVVLARGRAVALLSLPFSSRHHRPKRIPIAAPGDPLCLKNQQAESTSRGSCDPLVASSLIPAKMQWSQGPARRPLALLVAPRTPSVASLGCPRVGIPQRKSAARQEPRFSHPREEVPGSCGPGCLPPTEGSRRYAPSLAFFRRRDP